MKENEVYQLGSYLYKLFEGASWKTPLAVAGPVVTYLLPNERAQLLLWVAVGAVATDFVTGIAAAWKVGEKVESWKMRSTGVKAVMYGAAVFMAATLPRVVPVFGEGKAGTDTQIESAAYLVSFCLSWVILTEFKSIAENFVKAGVPVPEFLAKWLREKPEKKPPASKGSEPE